MSSPLKNGVLLLICAYIEHISLQDMLDPQRHSHSVHWEGHPSHPDQVCVYECAPQGLQQ